MIFKEILDYKELLISLVGINLRSRYHGTFLGLAWSLISPLFLLGIFIFVFKYIFSIPTHFGIRDFPLFVFLGFLPWVFFQGTILMASSCLIRYRSLLEKVYFPRIIIPLADIFSGLIHFIISFAVLAVALIYYGKTLDILLTLVFLPLLLVFQTALVGGLAFFISCLNVYYRDTTHILEILLMIGFYMTPIFYDISMVPQALRLPFLINPLSGLILSYRCIFLEQVAPPLKYLLSSGIISFVVLTWGYYFFKARDKYFAEEI